jgi:flagellar hook-basal body complex protein FliE
MINKISQIAAKLDTNPTDQTKPQNSLADPFKKIFEKTNHNLQKADQAVLNANTGGNVDLHEMMIAMEKADISLRFLVQVRNKAIDAYQEIMRMQV